MWKSGESFWISQQIFSNIHVNSFEIHREPRKIQWRSRQILWNPLNVKGHPLKITRKICWNAMETKNVFNHSLRSIKSSLGSKAILWKPDTIEDVLILEILRTYFEILWNSKDMFLGSIIICWNQLRSKGSPLKSKNPRRSIENAHHKTSAREIYWTLFPKLGDQTTQKTSAGILF